MNKHTKIISFVLLLLMVSVTFAQLEDFDPADYNYDQADYTVPNDDGTTNNNLNDSIDKMNAWVEFDTSWMFGGSCTVNTGGLPTKDSPNPTVAWILPAFILLLISTIIIVIVYYLSKIIEDPKMSSWANNELYQILATAVMMIMLIVLFLMIDTLIRDNANPTYTPPSQEGTSYSLVETALFYSQSIKASLTWEFIFLNYFSSVIHLVKSIGINLPFTLWGAFTSLNQIFEYITQPIGWLNMILGGALFEWILKEKLLCFIMTDMLTLFLPLGILLRCFPLTRSAGGGLIAIAIGFFFVYPYMLNINNLIVSAHYGVEPQQVIQYVKSESFNQMLTITPPFVSKALSSIFKEFLGRMISTILDWAIPVIVISILTTGILMPASIGILSISLMIDLFSIFIYEIAYLTIVVSIILPITNIFITMTFITEFSKLLGSDINLNSLMSLI